MKLGEIIDITRRTELDDATQPYLWSDVELIEYADDAQNQAADRANLLIDATTTAVCRITLVPGQAVYVLDERVLRVRRVFHAERRIELRPRVTRELDRGNSGWTFAEGDPAVFITDWQSGALRVAPIPVAAGTLELTVVRLPLVPLNDREDTPEIPARYHRELRHWIAKRAFEKRDAETEDLPRAAQSEAKFTAAFGPELSARTREWNARNLPLDDLDGSE